MSNTSSNQLHKRFKQRPFSCHVTDYSRIDCIVLGREITPGKDKNCYLITRDVDEKNGTPSRALLKLAPSWMNGDYTRAVSHFPSKGALFVDIETVGLSGNDATWLAGVSYVEHGQLTMHQYLARDFAEEEAVLRAFFDLAARKQHWVSFNGKSFDKSRLMFRARAKGIQVQPPKGHIDIYHLYREPARERGIKNPSLTEWERVRFPGFHRKDHIAGRDIPEAYRNYLKGGDPDPVRRAIDHNADDLRMLGVMYLEALADGR